MMPFLRAKLEKPRWASGELVEMTKIEVGGKTYSIPSGLKDTARNKSSFNNEANYEAFENMRFKMLPDFWVHSAASSCDKK